MSASSRSHTSHLPCSVRFLFLGYPSGIFSGLLQLNKQQVDLEEARWRGAASIDVSNRQINDIYFRPQFASDVFIFVQLTDERRAIAQMVGAITRMEVRVEFELEGRTPFAVKDSTDLP
ncbi:MAG: hypothetical protein KDB01_27230 [Planctomycetaceae bacterium]|nr:hypothetical protein [Planctomycetaceae bacterium]